MKSWFYLTCVLAAAGGQHPNGDPPVVKTDTPSELWLKMDREKILRCPVEQGRGEILVEWFKDSHLIGAGWRRYFKNDDGTLLIKNVGPRDAGQYECKANNGYGTVSFTFNVHVNEPGQRGRAGKKPMKDEIPYWTDPVLVKSMSESVLHYRTGSELRLQCEADGFPPPSITWFKDGKELITHWSGESWELTIENLREKDSGLYMCKISNILGSRNATFKVHIADTDLATSAKLAFHEQPFALNSTITEGKTATFYCNVKSSIPPTIMWLRQIDSPYQRLPNSTMISVDGLNYTIMSPAQSRTTADSSGKTWRNQLTVPYVTPQHTGWYLCVVTNPPGEMIFRKALLRVLAKQVEDKLPLHIVVGVPVAAILIALIAYAIYFLKKNQRKTNDNLVKVTNRPPLPTNPPPLPPCSKPLSHPGFASPARMDQYKLYHQLDPHAAVPLNDRGMYEPTPQPFDIRYGPPPSSDLTDSEMASAHRIQHYPSLYSCRTRDDI